MPFRTGHEGATVRMDPSGAVTVLAGVTSQGQGTETTVAQIVASELGVAFEAVSVVLGDTDATPFGLGAFASRQAVIGGGAAMRAARAVRDKIARIAAHLLEAAPDDLELADGLIAVKGAPGRAVSMLDVARVAHLETNRLPADVEPGLEATRFYDPIRGTFAAGAQAAVVEVDPVTGTIEILRYACVEDTGRVINPLIVEGQVLGAIAQGIGGALTEHLVYDAAGQLLTGTLMEYALPTAASMPAVDLDHIEVPADNLAGVRGVGEGGTLGPAAVLANAVADALAPLGVEVNELPLSPSRLWTACAAAPRPGRALTRGTAVEYPRASRDPMRRPPLLLVLVGLVVIALGETAGAVISQLRPQIAGYAQARVAANPQAPRSRGVRGVRRRGHRARRLCRRSRPVVLPHARPGPGPARDPRCRR